MQNVGAGWMMTQLTLSPLIVSLVQAATTLPVFLVILPAGALADMVDRRRFLLITQDRGLAGGSEFSAQLAGTAVGAFGGTGLAWVGALQSKLAFEEELK